MMADADSIRPAVQADIDGIYAFDQIAQHSNSRRQFIQRSVESGGCFVIMSFSHWSQRPPVGE